MAIGESEQQFQYDRSFFLWMKTGAEFRSWVQVELAIWSLEVRNRSWVFMIWYYYLSFCDDDEFSLKELSVCESCFTRIKMENFARLHARRGVVSGYRTRWGRVFDAPLILNFFGDYVEKLRTFWSLFFYPNDLLIFFIMGKTSQDPSHFQMWWLFLVL